MYSQYVLVSYVQLRISHTNESKSNSNLNFTHKTRSPWLVGRGRLTGLLLLLLLLARRARIAYTQINRLSCRNPSSSTDGELTHVCVCVRSTCLCACGVCWSFGCVAWFCATPVVAASCGIGTNRIVFKNTKSIEYRHVYTVCTAVSKSYTHLCCCCCLIIARREGDTHAQRRAGGHGHRGCKATLLRYT